MPILRLAYVTEFLIALMSFFAAWSQVAGQAHLDLLPWHVKLALGVGIAFATVKGTAAAVASKNAWNGRALRWIGIVLLLLAGCGAASYYAHFYLEPAEEEEEEPATPAMVGNHSSARLQNARLLALSAPTSATTILSRS